MPYINQRQLEQLKEALSSARLENCGVKQEHQDEMKLYLNTWVVWRLESVIEELEARKKMQEVPDVTELE